MSVSRKAGHILVPDLEAVLAELPQRAAMGDGLGHELVEFAFKANRKDKIAADV